MPVTGYTLNRCSPLITARRYTADSHRVSYRLPKDLREDAEDRRERLLEQRRYRVLGASVELFHKPELGLDVPRVFGAQGLLQITHEQICRIANLKRVCQGPRLALIVQLVQRPAQAGEALLVLGVEVPDDLELLAGGPRPVAPEVGMAEIRAQVSVRANSLFEGGASRLREGA